MLGQVAEITPPEDFGFLLTASGGLLYFHRNSLLSGDFDRLESGDEVHYVEDLGDTGPNRYQGAGQMRNAQIAAQRTAPQR